jgi:acyl-homoserine lactone synthase
MIFVVNGHNRQLFEADLLDMHRQRKALFVDDLGWKIPVVDDLEIDRFDGDDTIYLLGKVMPRGELLVSARLLPTVRPHLMSDLFPVASLSSFPQGSTVWEVSRFCCLPHLRRRARVQLVLEVVCAVMETALLFGVDQVIFAVNSDLLPLTLRCGWQAKKVSMNMGNNEDEVTAVVASITPEGLRRVRQRFEIPVPVTRFHADENTLARRDTNKMCSNGIVNPPGWPLRSGAQVRAGGEIRGT